MTKVLLTAADGGYVGTVVVDTQAGQLPAAILWGLRTFVLVERINPPAESMPVYVEGWALRVFTEEVDEGPVK